MCQGRRAHIALALKPDPSKSICSFREALEKPIKRQFAKFRLRTFQEQFGSPLLTQSATRLAFKNHYASGIEYLHLLPRVALIKICIPASESVVFFSIFSR